MAQSPSISPKQSLGLHAVDEEDLALISAHLQDALIRIGDLAFYKSNAALRLFVLGLIALRSERVVANGVKQVFILTV